jgi:hypothetical protein
MYILSIRVNWISGILMTKQREALEYVIQKCKEAEPNCAVMLTGSTARGEEHPDSDLDINVIINDDSEIAFNDIINENTRGGMVEMHLDQFDVDMDINWLYTSQLMTVAGMKSACGWYAFANGVLVHDPSGIGAQVQKAFKDWFDNHPVIIKAWEKQQVEVEKHNNDPDYEMDYPTHGDFCNRLIEIMKEEGIE